MGYYTRFSGQLDFEPELPDEAVPYFDEHFPTLSYCMGFSTEGLHPDGDSGKAYDVDKEFLGLYDRLTDMGVTVVGEVVMTGEDNVDISRAVFKPGQPPIIEKAEVRWPDGSKVQSTY